MQRSYQEIKAEAVGRWPGICQALGIQVSENHGPCPVCKTEKNHFRMDNKDGCGTWICTCGAGDGWALIMSVLGCDFKEAMEQVDGLLGGIKPCAVIEDKKVSPEVLRNMFKGSEKAAIGNGGGRYLLGRGLDEYPDTLRFHPGIKEPDSGTVYPAMLAVVSMPDGEAVSMHRTFLDPETWGKAPVEKPKKLMPGLKKISGGAIRLWPVEDCLGIAEGVETALACKVLFDIPTWSCISSTMMEAFIPPVGVKSVSIFADNDENYTGQKAAYVLANKLVLKYKLNVDVAIPDTHGCDFLDVLDKS